MAAPGDADALQLGMAVPTPSPRRPWKFAVLLGGGGLAVLCAYTMSPGMSNPMGSPTTLTEAELTSACFSFTGGTCLLHNCDEFRNATCMSGRCMCGGVHSCAGADGECHHGRNREVWADFKLRNKQWPADYLYVPDFPLFQQLRSTDRDNAQHASQFALTALPAEEDSHQKFMLTSTKFSNYAVAVAKFYHVEAMRIDQTWTADPQRLAITVCVPDDDHEAVMIGGIKRVGGKQPFKKANIAWITLKSFSWRVFGERGDENGDGIGSEGYWYPEPRIPADAGLPACSSL